MNKCVQFSCFFFRSKVKKKTFKFSGKFPDILEIFFFHSSDRHKCGLIGKSCSKKLNNIFVCNSKIVNLEFKYLFNME